MFESIPEVWRCEATGEMSLEILLPSGMLMDIIASMEVKVLDLKAFILDQVGDILNWVLAVKLLYNLHLNALDLQIDKKNILDQVFSGGVQLLIRSI